MLKPQKLTGIFAAMVTPYRPDGSVSLETARELAACLADGGLDGVLLCGSTGEFPLLTQKERMDLAQAVQEEAGDRLSVTVNVSSLRFRETEELILHARRQGISSVFLLPPYYYGFDQEALLRYFQQVSKEAGDLSIYLYNIPANAKNAITPRLLAAVSQTCPNIRGIKDSSMDFMVYTDYQRAVERSDFSFLTGNDAQILAALQAGGDGAVAATAGIFPKAAKGIQAQFQQGDLTGANECQSFLYSLRELCRGIMPIITHKRLLERLGFPMGPPRFPFRPLTPLEQKRFDQAVDNLNFPSSVAFPSIN